MLICIIAVTTRDIPKKRINRNGHEEKRRILQNWEDWLIWHSGRFRGHGEFSIDSLLLRFSLDPRIKRIKQQEKEARDAKKRVNTPGAPAKKTKEEEAEEKNKAELEAKQKEEEEKVCMHHA